MWLAGIGSWSSLSMTHVGHGSIDVEVDVEVEQHRRPTVFLHDELRVENAVPVRLREGELGVVFHVEQCTTSDACVEVTRTASALCQTPAPPSTGGAR